MANQDEPAGFISTDKRDYFSSFCDDIIIDILCNLDKKSVFTSKLVCQQWNQLISSESFVEQYLNRAKPMTIAVFTRHNPGRLRYETILYYVDDHGSTAKLVNVRASRLPLASNDKIRLRGLCDGILLLQWVRSGISLLYNPFTEESVMPILPFGRILGIFFDKFNEEYKILQCFPTGDDILPVYYTIFGLRTKHQKRLGTFRYSPFLESDIGVTLPMSMCWIVHRVDSYHNTTAVQYTRVVSENVMVYEFDTESLHIISGPIDDNRRFNPKARVQLQAWENKLVFLEWKGPGLDIWVLDDFAKICWVKRHMITLGEVFQVVQAEYAFTGNSSGRLVCIVNGELLVKWPDEGLFWYNIGSKKVRRIETGPDFNFRFQHDVRAFKHVPTSVSPKLIAK